MGRQGKKVGKDSPMMFGPRQKSYPAVGLHQTAGPRPFPVSVLPEEAQKALRKGKDSKVEGNEGLGKKEFHSFEVQCCELVPDVVHAGMWHLNAFDALIRSPSNV